MLDRVITPAPVSPPVAAETSSLRDEPPDPLNRPPGVGTETLPPAPPAAVTVVVLPPILRPESGTTPEPGALLAFDGVSVPSPAAETLVAPLPTVSLPLEEPPPALPEALPLDELPPEPPTPPVASPPVAVPASPPMPAPA